MANTPTKKIHIRSKVLALVVLMASLHQAHGEPRLNANNEAYFQDLTSAQAYAHAVESLPYGEALFLMHSGEDLQALILLQKEIVAGRKLGFYPHLLRASIASKQGVSDIAADALEFAKKQSESSESVYDLDRMLQFQAELAYEEENMTLLAQSLASVTHIENLPDPDGLYFLHIQSALNQDYIDLALEHLKNMAFSPWQAFSQVNIGLWYYRKGDYEQGIDILNTALIDLDQSVTLDAYEYWYKKGRVASSILSEEQFALQKDELRELTEKVLTLVGYGHIKLLNKDQLEVGSPEFEQRLTLAKNAIFQIPQESLYADQGLELLVQTIMTVFETNPKETLIESSAASATKKSKRKQQLQTLLNTLAGPEKPILTRLRSEFMRLKIAAQDGRKQELQAVKALQSTIEGEIESRQQLLDQPASEYTSLLEPFYSPSGIDTFDRPQIAGLPVHTTSLIQWLSLPKTRNYIKTLTFFKEGLEFSQQWYAYKETLETQALTNQEQNNNTNMQEKLLQKQAILQAELDEVQQAYKTNSLDLATAREARVLKKITTINTTIEQLEKSNTTKQLPELYRAREELKHKRGQFIWQQTLLQPQRRISLQQSLAQLRDSLQENLARVESLNAKTPTPRLNTSQVASLDQRIRALDTRTTIALEQNHRLFVNSFKHYIRQEQQHLQAALVKLKLKQAVLIQNSGIVNEGADYE